MNVRELFENALALPPAERDIFLARECRDAARRKVVESLLAADAACDARVLDGPFDALLDRVGDAGAEAQPPPAGTRVGPFVLRERLGEGGSSIVYRAEREQAGVVQVVALKLLRRGIYSAEETARFRRERLALAQLRHPGIARLVEGGVTEASVPYIALELVDGTPITDYAREHRLDLRARLRLFVATCRAVEAAHRALIVHRDLKPSNVLVARDGEVKLLDFGIAKLLDDDAADGTQTQHRALTPAYAAPEQFEGGAITTATDVYALGVLLGELVGGSRRAAGDAHTPSSRIDADTEPGVLPAPPRNLRRLLRGDLDNIVMKATATEPERRYASAGALADDVERHLAGQPVAAHPPSRTYRLRKFVARHKGGVVATLAVALAILAALGVALWQAQVARREAARATAVRGFMESMFAPIRAGIANGRQPSLRDLVDQGAQRIESDQALGPAERVDLLLTFSRLYDYLAEPDRRQALADRAGNLADAAFGAGDPLALDALVARGTAAVQREDHAAAATLLGEAERRLDAAHERGDNWILVEDALAAVANDLGDPERALLRERAALAARIARYGEDSDVADGGYANLGFALSGTGRFTEAVEAYRRAHAGRVARNPRSAPVARTLAALGDVETMAGDLGPARAHLRDAMALFDEVDAGGKVSSGHVNDTQYHCLIELVTASPLAQAACSHGADLAQDDYRARRSGADMTLGRMQRMTGMERLQAGDLAAARAALESSAALLADAPAPWQGRTDIARGELALVEGDAAAAAAFLANGVERLGHAYPRYLHGYGLALLALACADAGAVTGCDGDTAAAARRALEEDAYRWNPLLLPAHVALARVDLDAGRPGDAAERLRAALGHAGKPIAATQPHLVAARLWLAIAEAQAGTCERARSDAARALENGALEPGRRPPSDPHPLHAAALRAAHSAGACGDLLSKP